MLGKESSKPINHSINIGGRILDWNAIYRERGLPPSRRTESNFPGHLYAEATEKEVRLSPVQESFITFTAKVKNSQYGDVIEFIAYLKYPPQVGIQRRPFMPKFEPLIVSSYDFLLQHNPQVAGIYLHFEEDLNHENRSEFYDDFMRKRKERKEIDDIQADKVNIIHARQGKNPLQFLHLTNPENIHIHEDIDSTGAHNIHAYYLFNRDII